MRARRLGSAVTLALFLWCSESAFAWGFKTHRWINEAAITTLPEPLRSYFRSERRRISDAAVEPDTRLRARHGQQEAVRHYIDLDLYGDPPFRELPRLEREAIRKFGRETVERRGRLPWTILEKYDRLVRELRGGDWRSAVWTAGLAGHYVGDAFMPLHTTDNHDGQKSGNRGVHKAIERDLVDARLDDYGRQAEGRIGDLKPEPPTPDRVFAILVDNYYRVAPLLRADDRARRAGRVGSDAYLEVLDREAGRELSSRLAAAAAALGSFWLSAWDEAGRPAPPGRGLGDSIDSPRTAPYHRGAA